MDIQFIQIRPAELKELIQETIRCAFESLQKTFSQKSQRYT